MVASDEIIEEENVTLSCEVWYTSNISPMSMSWTDSHGQPVESHTDLSQPGHTTSHITVTATAPTLSSFTSTTHFTPPTDLPSSATNTPDYKHDWTSDELNIKCNLYV